MKPKREVYSFTSTFILLKCTCSFEMQDAVFISGPLQSAPIRVWMIGRPTFNKFEVSLATRRVAKKNEENTEKSSNQYPNFGIQLGELGCDVTAENLCSKTKSSSNVSLSIPLRQIIERRNSVDFIGSNHNKIHLAPCQKILKWVLFGGCFPSPDSVNQI